MRARVATVVIVCSLAGVGAASAAELFNDRSARGYSGHSYTYDYNGRRADTLIIYDDQPGVLVRAYWEAPWRNRHYFPTTGKRPRIGRLENLSARSVTKPAESYYRFWSTPSAFLPEPPRDRLRDYDLAPAPHMEPYQK